MRVVLDTSVLVAAIRSQHGASHLLFSALPSPKFSPVLSISLAIEYETLLMRSENLGARTPQQASKFLDNIVSFSHLQEVFFHWRPALPDADDDMILELAVAANCRYIVTHNLRDFRGCETWGVTAISPGEFVRNVINK